jgi:hypothetical protein
MDSSGRAAGYIAAANELELLMRARPSHFPLVYALEFRRGYQPTVKSSRSNIEDHHVPISGLIDQILDRL